MASQHIEDALLLLRAEYLDMPGLSLTPVEVEGLLDLDPPTAATILQALEDSRFLEHTPDRRFALALLQDQSVSS